MIKTNIKTVLWLMYKKTVPFILEEDINGRVVSRIQKETTTNLKAKEVQDVALPQEKEEAVRDKKIAKALIKI